MYILDAEAMENLKETFSGVGAIKITKVFIDEREKLVDALNILKMLVMPRGDLALVKDSIVLTAAELGGSKSMTASKLLASLKLPEPLDVEDFSKITGGGSGMYYHPGLKLPILYNPRTRKITLPDTSTIKVTGDLAEGLRPLYNKHKRELLPAVYLVEQARLARVKASLQARGFSGAPRVGDTVIIRSYASMVEEYGEDTTSASIAFARAAEGYGVPFIRPLEYLCGEQARITAYDKATGMVKLVSLEEEDEDKFDISEIEVEGVMCAVSPKPKFHETHLLKV